MSTMSKGYLAAEVRNIIKEESALVKHLDHEEALSKMSMVATPRLEQLFQLHFEPTFSDGNLNHDIDISLLEEENDELKAECIAMEDFAAGLKNNEKILSEANTKLQTENSFLKKHEELFEESYETLDKDNNATLEVNKSMCEEIKWLRSVIEKAVK